MELKNVTRKGGEFQVERLRNDNTVNRPRPYLPSHFVHRLKALNPHLKFEWNGKCGYWEVWFHNGICESYKVYRVVDGYDRFRVIDGRVFDDIRHALWFSQRIRHNIQDMEYKMLEARTHKKAQQYDEHVQAGKEIAPLMRTLDDAGTASHGKSKNLFPGF